MTRTAFIAVTALLATAGCVERRITIISDPPGARAFLDGDDLGVTPATTSFLHYGGRGVRVQLKGHKTVHVVEQIDAPYYQVFPFDLFADVIVPWTITDRHYLVYKLEPAEPISKEVLIARANEFRAEYNAALDRERADRLSPEMERRRALRREREKQGVGRKKWYRLFF